MSGRVGYIRHEERPDRRRLRGARRPLRARRRRAVPRARLPDRREGRARVSVSVMQMVRDGKVTEMPGIGKTLESKLVALDETGEIPQAVKLREKFPRGLIAITHLPGFGPKRARRLYDELGIDSLEALRARRERQEVRGLRGFGAKVEEQLLEALAAGADGTPAPRILLSRALPIARAGRRGAARRARRAPRRGGGLAAPPGRLGQGPRRDRHRRRRRGARRGARRSSPSSSPSQQSGAGRRARDHARRPEGRPQGRRARPVRQRAPALHRLQGPQRAAARGRRAQGPARLGVRDPRRRDGRDGALRDRGGGLRDARAAVHRAGAARGPRRAGGGARRARCPSSSRSRTCAATCTRHTTLSDGNQDVEKMAEGARRARLRVPRDHRPLGDARVRQPRRHPHAASSRSSACARSTPPSATSSSC